MLALKLWHFMANGMGSVDWAAFPLAMQFYEIDEDQTERMIERLLLIKGHKPGAAPQDDENEDGSGDPIR